MNIGIAVLGAGRWGVNLARNFLAHPQADVIAIVDPNLETLQSLPQRLGADKQGRPHWNDKIILTTDWLEIFKMPQVEAVAIATPATTHYTLITAALQHHLHVLAEKPLTIDTAQAFELCRLAETQQRQLVIDHTYLFHPAVTAGKTVIQEGKLGNLRYGYSTRTNLGPVRQDVDALWDLAIHDICIFNSWLSETPTQVQASGNVWLQTLEKGENISNDSSQLTGIADLVWVKLIYPSGFQASIHLSWLNPDKQRRLGVVGSQGTLIFDEMLPTPLTIYTGTFEQIGNQFQPVNVGSEVLNLPSVEPLQQVCDHFLQCVSTHSSSSISSGLVGANLVQILKILSESIQHSGKIISVNS